MQSDGANFHGKCFIFDEIVIVQHVKKRGFASKIICLRRGCSLLFCMQTCFSMPLMLVQLDSVQYICMVSDYSILCVAKRFNIRVCILCVFSS